MGFAYDLVVASVVTIIAIVVHFLGVELVAPGTTLWDMTAAYSGGELSVMSNISLWFEVLVVYIPLIAIGGVWLWTVVKTYKRQVQTAVRPPT